MGFLTRQYTVFFLYITQITGSSPPICTLQFVFKPLRQIVNLFLHKQFPPNTSFLSTPGFSFMTREHKRQEGRGEQEKAEKGDKKEAGERKLRLVSLCGKIKHCRKMLNMNTKPCVTCGRHIRDEQTLNKLYRKSKQPSKQSEIPSPLSCPPHGKADMFCEWTPLYHHSPFTNRNSTCLPWLLERTKVCPSFSKYRNFLKCHGWP